MAEESLSLLKLTLNHELYNKHKGIILDEFFPKPIDKLWASIKQGHDKYKRDLHEHELLELIKINNGTMTSAAKDVLQELLQRMTELPSIGNDIAEDIIRNAYRHEVGRAIIEESYGFIENKAVDIDKLSQLVAQANENYLPIKEQIYVPTDVEELLEQFDNSPGWKFNLPNLDRHIPNGLHGGELALIFARPEMGKSCAWISLAAAPGGWCDQGASVTALCNEEYARRNMLRAISSCTGLTVDQIKEDTKRANNEFYIRDKLKMVDAVDWTIDQVSAYAAKYKPNILVVDQLDKVKSVDGTGGIDHERLRDIYTGAREIAKRNDCVVVALSQASIDAEGKDLITYSMLEGSKTGKAAEIDLAIGIGHNSIIEQAGGNGDTNLRMWTASKNKLSGWHGSVYSRIEAQISRYKAVD